MEISNLVNWALGEGWALVVFGGIYFLFDQHKKSNGELAELQEEKNTLKKQVADLEKQITKKTDVIKSVNRSRNTRFKEIFAYQIMQDAILAEYKNKKKIEATSVKKLRNIARNSTPFKLSFATRMTKEPTFVDEEDLINPTP
tara:strand:+ start:456 stop:884 length:429 start_codon:yes stop_codon:yes gene_type:complete